MRTYFGQIADQKYINKENAERIFSLLVQNIGNIKEGSNILLAFLGHPKYYKLALERFPKCKIFILEDVSSKQCYDFCSYIPKSDIIYIDFNDKKYLYYIENLYKLNMGFKDKKFDIIVGNPPYNKNLHLRIIEKVITLLKEDGKGCFIHPARWVEDILAITDKKQKNDYKKFYNSIVNKIHNIDLLNAINSRKYFNIEILSDLMITYIDMCNDKDKIENHFDKRVFSTLNKIISKLNNSVYEKIDFNELKGIRVEIKEMMPIYGSNSDNRKPVDKLFFVNKEYYIDGYNIEKKFWTEAKARNQFTKEIGTPFLLSIRFDNINKANNFIESNRNSKFMNNLQYMIQTDQHVPLKFIPYLIDDKHGEYEKPWTDEDYCEYFGLTEEETQFMCRKVDDYRIKDFINYTEI